MKPTRGSFSSPTASARTARTASFTRRIRSLIDRHDPALHAGALELLTVQVPLCIGEQPLDSRVVAGNARHRDPRPLPELVVVDLRDGSAESLLQLRLDGLHELALALQRARLGEVQLGRENPDVAGAHGPIESLS